MFPIKQTLVAILVIASLSAYIHAAVNDPQDEIVVPEGTPINVVVAKEVTSKEAKPNDPVEFTVTEDLVINGQVVPKWLFILIGAPILGLVWYGFHRFFNKIWPEQ